ncbi:MAG: FAD-dependent oxidoreductase [Steroidobacteraceae bacterium]|nr:FAD-dependent oxidoreductase [Steroidobacteraceae bacterium]MDW8260147.1 FAD-dependent oxidoreductase [Gammaproteobacteria bacterium]
MRVVVIGAGMVGLTSAYFLRAAGADVTVIERRNGPGLETSFANGSVLHPSLAEPWNSPGVFVELLRNLGREDAAMLLRLRELPRLIGWGIGFVRNSFPRRFRRNAEHATRLARYSLQVLGELRRQLRLEFSWYRRGVLVLFRDLSKLNAASSWARSFGPLGTRHLQLTPTELAKLEPALEPIAEQLSGALYYPDEEGGDPYAYCVELERCLRAQQVEIVYGREIIGWLRRNGRVLAAVDTEGRQHAAERFLLAAASYSTPLARAAGLRIPLRPAKGYSVTLPRGSSGHAPNIPVVDTDLHIAVVPVGADVIRVAGTAEFAGYDLTIHPARIANLMNLLRRLYPAYAASLAPADIKPWCGLRPMCPDGVPLVGATRVAGLYLNTGHGQLGWTMAAGSGRLAADLLMAQTPAIDAAPYAPTRFD